MGAGAKDITGRATSADGAPEPHRTGPDDPVPSGQGGRPDLRHTIPTMTEVPPFLFVVTSTALVLGAAITIRGLLGFRPGADNAVLPAPILEGEPADALLAQTSGSDLATPSGSASGDLSPVRPPNPGVRDLKEPFVMTFAGVFICMFALLAIGALVNSA